MQKIPFFIIDDNKIKKMYAVRVTDTSFVVAKGECYSRDFCYVDRESAVAAWRMHIQKQIAYHDKIIAGFPKWTVQKENLLMMLNDEPTIVDHKGASE